jgi:hypothetical protein
MHGHRNLKLEVYVPPLPASIPELKVRIRTAIETITVLTSFKAAPHNRYQPHPAEPAQYTICSNTVFVLLKMGIMMPETC